MPIVEVKTVSANKEWTSPDGQRTIFAVTFDYQGKKLSAKSFSKVIATPGWSGSVETYEKEGRYGSETYVKQPPREDGGGYGGGYNRPSPAGGGYKKDEKAIQAMWAIGKATDATTRVEGMDYVATIESLAQELFLMVDRVKVVTESIGATPDVVYVPDADVDQKRLNEIFDETEAVNVDETPWPKGS